MQTPPRVIVEVAGNRWAGQSADIAANAITDHYEPSIAHFVQSQRQQQSLSNVPVRRTQMTMPGLTVNYTSMHGLETIRMVVFPDVPLEKLSPPEKVVEPVDELAPPPEIKIGVQDVISEGYLVLRTRSMSAPATPAGTFYTRAGNWWLGSPAVELFSLSHYPAPWGTGALPGPEFDEAGAGLGGDVVYVYSIADVHPAPIGLEGLTIDPITGLTNMAMHHAGPDYFAGFAGFGEMVEVPIPAAEAITITSTIQLNGVDLCHLTLPLRDWAASPTGIVTTLIIRFGGEALKEHSFADNRNLNKLLLPIVPSRSDDLLPAYFPYVIPNALDMDDPYWDLPFWTMMNWPKSYWFADQWVANGLDVTSLATAIPPTPPPTINWQDITFSTSKLAAGINTITVTNNQLPGLGAYWDIHAGFYSKDAFRPVYQSPHRSGLIIMLNDKPRYWYGNVGDDGTGDTISVSVDLSTMVSSDELIIPPLTTMPDPKTMPTT